MKFIIKGNNYKGNALPSYNDYITQCRSNKYGANKWKKKYQEIIYNCIINQTKKIYIDNPFIMNLLICEGNNRRDKDNVEGMAKKLILDTLQEYKLISNDKNYQGGITMFKNEKNNSYIQVKIKEAKNVNSM